MQEAHHDQERFNRSIRVENERLNRLIRNLYLYLLQFRHFTERDLYDSICQEVAVYFRAAYADIYLVRYEEEGARRAEAMATGETAGTANAGKVRLPSDARLGGLVPPEPCRLTKWLELAGSFGPGRRALKQQYVRQQNRARYELEFEPGEAKPGRSVTRAGFNEDGPTLCASGYELRDRRVKSDKSGREQANPQATGVAKPRELRHQSSRQEVWYQDGVYNSYRSGIVMPLIRDGVDLAPTRIGARGDAGELSIEPYRKIGVIKVENRVPPGIAAFLDIPEERGAQSRLYFNRLWQITALRPYVRDLVASVKDKQSVFLPLHNNIGWQQYFEDHPAGREHMRALVAHLRRLRDSAMTHTEGARRHAGTGVGEPATGASGELSKVANDLADKYAHLEGWLEELLECLIRLESWLQHLQAACNWLLEVSEEPPDISRPLPSFFNAHNLMGATNASGAAQGNCAAAEGATPRSIIEALRNALLDALTNGDKRAGKALLTQQRAARTPEAAYLVRQKVDALCRQRARDLVDRMGAGGEFNVVTCLTSRTPPWDFDAALEDVSAQLRRIAESVAAVLPPPDDYELRSEQNEARAAARAALAELDKAGEPGPRLALALAAATIHADAFDEIDKKRIVFVASHVTQVLDNYLVYQARQRRLPLDFDDLDTLGLEQTGLEFLDRLGYLVVQIADGLAYLLRCEAYHCRARLPAIVLHAPSTRDFIQAVRDALSGGDVMRYVLVEIEARGCDFRAGEILVIVREQAERLGLRYTADSAGLAFLLPDASADGKDWCAGMTLTAVETSADQAPGPRLKLEVRVQRAALSKRDTRTLWSAVELLGYVWCAVEAGVRGRSHVAG